MGSPSPRLSLPGPHRLRVLILGEKLSDAALPTTSLAPTLVACIRLEETVLPTTSSSRSVAERRYQRTLFRIDA
jgi:hypothetical protein